MTTATEPSAGPTAERGSASYRWVFLWGWPLRLTHWVSAVCIVVLIVTGFYIGRPYFLTTGEASTHFLMGWARFLHFMAAAIVIASAILRIYWLFAGRKYARWAALFPVRRQDWHNLWRMLKYYLYFSREAGRPHYLGHHPLQQLSYTALYAIVLFQVLTGLSLYGLSNPTGLVYGLFGWVSPLFGGIQYVRFFHHAVTWLLIIFIPLHVYLAMRADVVDREGEISSIFSGGRFVRSDVTFEDE